MSSSPIQVLSGQTLEVFKGQSKTWFLTLKEDPGGGPADLTGATLYFTVRKALDATSVTFEKSSAVSTEIDILVPTTAGEAKVFLVPSDTNNLASGDYVYDMWAKLASERRYPIVEPSKFVIKTPVTVIP